MNYDSMIISSIWIDELDHYDIYDTSVIVLYVI